MTQLGKKTILITGANSGLGFEAAAQAAGRGYGRVILACRSLEKADAAKARLVERTGADVYDTLAVDMAEADSVERACKELVSRGHSLDVLILNAGVAGGSGLQRNSAGIEMTFAATLFGHHLMTIRLLAAGLVSDAGRIIIAGSEGARGEMPGMKVYDHPATAKEHYDGDLAKEMEAVARGESPHPFRSMDAYVNAKLFVTWWAAALSRRLAKGQTVNAVSPGSVPSTGFARNMPWAMRVIVMPMMKWVGPLMGMAGPIDKAARRYLDAAQFDDDTTGQFFASPPKKAVGPLQVQKSPAFFHDRPSQDACWDMIVSVTGVGYPAESAAAASA